MTSPVLIISFVEWAGAFQRPQHLACGLAQRGWDVVYASPGYLHRRHQPACGLELPNNLHIIEPLAFPGSGRLRLIQSLNIQLMHHALTRFRKQLNHECWGSIIFNDPRWSRIAENQPAYRRIFDCMDDLSKATLSGADALEIHAPKVADRIWTGTLSLADRLQKRHSSVTFIPCGVDTERFAHPCEEAVQCTLKDLPPGNAPLAGYFGAMNERMDIELIKALLEVGWRVLLIGPATSRAPRLPEHPALKWIGARPYAQLPAYLAHFDLALIPYDVTGAHRFLYPVKALEYLSASKPVLSTPLPDVIRLLGDYVEIAATCDAWRECGRRLLNDRSEAIRRAQQGALHAASRSWGAMLDEMEKDLYI